MRARPALGLLFALALSHVPVPAPAASAAPAPAAAPAKADLVFTNGAVYTVDRVRTWAEAVAVRGGTIVYVGGNSGAWKHVGPKTRVVDLRGKMLLPGFQDAHTHPLWAGIEKSDCYLYDLESREEYLKAVADYAARHPAEPWIRGAGWSMAAFPNGIPHRRDLDAVVPDRPVYLVSKDGHSAWLNSKALALAGIGRGTPDPEGGRIDRDQDGEPVGSLQESAVALPDPLLPPYTQEAARGGLRTAVRELNALGITSFQEANAHLGVYQGYRMLDAYRDLDREGGLTARVVLSLALDPDRWETQIPELNRARRDYTRGRVRAHTVKIFQDGVIESKTAAMLEPYLEAKGEAGGRRAGGEGGERGMALIDPETLKRIVTRIDREGFQLHFHCIGDAAIRQVFDALEAARRANGARDSRHHLSHIQVFHPDDIPRFRDLGAVANFQPLWALAEEYITELTLPILPPETHRWIYPIASVLRSGGVVAFGSDWSVTSANPLEEIEVAVRRADWNDPGAASFIPEERVDLRDAIAAFTINAAYVNFQDDITGSIEPGKRADLVVLDRNLFAIPPESISESRVLLTLFDGKAVHGDPAALAR